MVYNGITIIGHNEKYVEVTLMIRSLLLITTIIIKATLRP